VGRWTDFIDAAPACGHAAQIYGDPSELGESVAAYLGGGFATGAPAVVIATPAHWEIFAGRLDLAGWSAESLAADGLLTVADAEATLESFMEDGSPSQARFEAVVGGLLDEIAGRFPAQTIRAFGEMVDLLAQRGELDAAIALEELWNALAESRDFALLCGYRLDLFDRAVQTGTLPEVCRTHSHVRAVADPVRLSTAVDRALAEVLGPLATAQVYVSVAEEMPRGSLPRGQAILMWLSAHQPVNAGRVLSRARSHYLHRPSVASS
jgi:hypothetical protein